MKTTITRAQKFAQTAHLFRPGMFAGIHFDANDNAGGDDNEGDGDDGDQPKSYTQAEIDAMISQRVNAAKRQSQKDIKAWEDKYKELESKVNKPGEKPKDDKTITLEDLNRIKSEWEQEKNTELDNYRKQIGNLLGEKKNSAVISAAAKANVVDPSLVAKLVSDDLGFDEDGSIFVRKAPGSDEAKTSKSGLMTVEEYIGEFLKDKPYLVKSGAPGGGGSHNNSAKKQIQDNSNKSPLDKISSGWKARKDNSDD